MCGVELDVVLASGSNSTFFLCGGQNQLRFCVFFLAWGSKFARVLGPGKKLHIFVGRWTDLVFVQVVEIDLVFVYWTKSTWL